MKPNTHKVTPINTNGNVYVNGQTTAETFNNYFVTVAQNINVNNANASSNHENPISYITRAFSQPFPTIKLKCVSLKEIEDIKSLKAKDSHGYNEISTKILKLSIYYISSPLTYICNRMLLSGTFQQD